ncbi:vWA domain-containing protein, partial [Kineosporia babensis]
ICLVGLMVYWVASGTETLDGIESVVNVMSLIIALIVLFGDLRRTLPLPQGDPKEHVQLFPESVWRWLTRVEVVLLPVLGVWVLRRPGVDLYDVFGVLAIALPVVVFWPGLRRPRRGAEYLFRSIALPMLVLSLTAATWDVLPLPDEQRDRCGAARIEVDQALLSTVQSLFAANSSRLENGRECAQTVEFAALGTDPHHDLRIAQTPVAGVITSDPATIRGLGGEWADLTVGVAPLPNWELLGMVPAVVLLEEEAFRSRAAVPAAELVRQGIELGFRDVVPRDPVAAAVEYAAPELGIERRTVDLDDERACLGVVLPAGTQSACRDNGLRELKLEDSDGNTIGAEVLAIPLIPESQRTSAQAVRSFLSWLKRSEARDDLGLVAASTPPQEVADRPPALATIERPLHLTVLIDASQSMGTVKEGDTTPYAAARQGVRAWASTKPLDPQDQLTVVQARTGAGPPADRSLSMPGDVAPGRELLFPEGPGGKTGLAELLPVQSGPPFRSVTVLLTDGMNVLTEQPISPGSRRGLNVVVIGSGCARQPTWAQARCRSIDINSQHVADQLTLLAEEK